MLGGQLREVGLPAGHLPLGGLLVVAERQDDAAVRGGGVTAAGQGGGRWRLVGMAPSTGRTLDPYPYGSSPRMFWPGRKLRLTFTASCCLHDYLHGPWLSR